MSAVGYIEGADLVKVLNGYSIPYTLNGNIERPYIKMSSQLRFYSALQ